MAELAASHLAVQALAIELEAGGKALDDRDQAGSVRLAGGCEAERHRPPTLAARSDVPRRRGWIGWPLASRATREGG